MCVCITHIKVVDHTIVPLLKINLTIEKEIINKNVQLTLEGLSTQVPGCPGINLTLFNN